MSRPADTKLFALTPDYIDGASRIETLNANEEYSSAKSVHTLCQLYAAAYNETMLIRLQKEKPEFFEENNIDKHELLAHLTNNMCLKESKYKSKAYREAVAGIKEKEHLNEQIRRLSNGGDRFHPYF